MNQTKAEYIAEAKEFILKQGFNLEPYQLDWILSSMDQCWERGDLEGFRRCASLTSGD